MKSWCGSQQLAKCNFCLNWYDITSQHYSALTNLYVCPGCFDRCRKSSHFKVAQPKSMNVYEVLFKKCPAQELQMLKGQSNELLDLTDLYEKNNLGSDKLEIFRNFVANLVSYENDVLNQIEPVRQLINKIYRGELNRIEKIWEDVVQEVDNIGIQIAQYRKTVTTNLQKQVGDLEIVEEGFSDTKQKINSKLQNYSLEHVKEKFKDSPSGFFKNGFKVGQETCEVLLTERVNKIVLSKANSQSEYFTNASQTNHKRQMSILKFKDKKLGSNYRSNEKQNTQDLTERSISPFLRSPRDSKLKSHAFRNSRKEATSVDSNAQSDDERKEFTKSQIKQMLKNKPSLQSYRPNEQKIESKLLYADMVMKQTIFQALETTFIGNSMIELVAYNTQQLDFQCYLEMLKWSGQLQIVKFVKVGLTDEHLNMLLSYLKKADKIDSLVVTSNLLTDGCLDILWKYFSTEKSVKNVYLGRNYIQVMKCRQRINDLKNLGVNVFI